MNSSFISDNFLLESTFAEELFHDYARKLPIIDYHNHLPPKEIAQDIRYDNLTSVWINGDHYKWRAMRTLGINEAYITGSVSDLEKFKKWAETVPYTMRNPLYHWTHLELKRYFDISKLLNPHTAEDIYFETKDKLQTEAYSCRNLLTKANVEFLCTTEDPTDNLRYHRMLSNSDFKIAVSTAFRPDKAILIESDSYLDYLNKLGAIENVEIHSYKDLKSVLKNRIDFFHKNGCRLSDHGLNFLSYENIKESDLDQIFLKKIRGSVLTKLEIEKFHCGVLIFLCESYHELGWVQQFHLGAMRNNNSRMLKLIGPDTGWDSIGDYPQANKLSKFLNMLDSENKLCKTIIYNLNPADNEVIASMIGNFNDGSVKGKVQFGSGWWFLDQKDGMTKQLNALSNMGLISCFIGMLTDSRSFLSFPRHEYFRRILCNLFGEEIKKGELPQDMKWIGQLISDICYNNAKQYFEFSTFK